MIGWLILLAAVFFALAALALLVGLALPRAHLAASSIRLSARPDEVWEVVSDFTSAPEWRPELDGIERAGEVDGRPVWKETGRHGSMSVLVERFEPPREMSTRILDTNLGFGGSWTYRVEPADGGSRVVIVERGEITQPVYRLVSRIMGHHRTQHAYLKALAARLGEPGAEPVVAPDEEAP